MDAMASNPYDDKQGSRLIARVFALLALALVTIVLVAVVSSSLDDTSSGPSSTSNAASTPTTPQPKDDYYVVKPNDTLTGIASKEGVSAARIQALNRGRGIDFEVLQPTQCVNIVPDGCKKLASGG
jgi:LysM repeat protein